MTKDRILTYYRELATIVQEANQIKGGIDQANAALEMAEATENSKHAENIVQQRAAMKTALEKIEKLATEKANRKDLAGCERLLQAIEARLREVQESEQTLAALEANFEIAVTLGEYADDQPGRAAAETSIAKVKERIQKITELAAALVPNKPVLLKLT